MFNHVRPISGIGVRPMHEVLSSSLAPSPGDRHESLSSAPFSGCCFKMLLQVFLQSVSLDFRGNRFGSAADLAMSSLVSDGPISSEHPTPHDCLA